MENNSNVKKVWFDEENIFIETLNETKSHPLSWFPRLLNATKAQREDFTLTPFGIHWEKIDEDLSFEGFFYFKKNKIVV